MVLHEVAVCGEVQDPVARGHPFEGSLAGHRSVKPDEGLRLIPLPVEFLQPERFDLPGLRGGAWQGIEAQSLEIVTAGQEPSVSARGAAEGRRAGGCRKRGSSRTRR